MHLYHLDGELPVLGYRWVFGSNLAGRHGAGAALVAVQRFNAVYGTGTGLQGQAYAIPTKDRLLRPLTIPQIADYVDTFVSLTRRRPKSRWWVTRVGCGLAGYSDHQIAPMFKLAKNCSFAEQWKPFLEAT
jgi:hypothetical protein